MTNWLTYIICCLTDHVWIEMCDEVTRQRSRECQQCGHVEYWTPKGWR